MLRSGAIAAQSRIDRSFFARSTSFSTAIEASDVATAVSACSGGVSGSALTDVSG
jgi:hypothetical protein